MVAPLPARSHPAPCWCRTPLFRPRCRCHFGVCAVRQRRRSDLELPLRGTASPSRAKDRLGSPRRRMLRQRRSQHYSAPTVSNFDGGYRLHAWDRWKASCHHDTGLHDEYVRGPARIALTCSVVAFLRQEDVGKATFVNCNE